MSVFMSVGQIQDTTLIARFTGPTWGPSGAPCWPHELCYLGSSLTVTLPHTPPLHWHHRDSRTHDWKLLYTHPITLYELYQIHSTHTRHISVFTSGAPKDNTDCAIFHRLIKPTISMTQYRFTHCVITMGHTSQHITWPVTSHHRHGVSNHQQFGNPLMTAWFPSKRVSKTKNVLHVMTS